MDTTKEETSLTLPYFARIPVRPVRIGTLITVKGKVNENPSRFAVDFIRNPLDPTPDIALHFNPRFDTCQVVRNSRIQREGGWGTEELACTKKFPFRFGSSFTVEFFIADWAFLLSVDGRLTCIYEHRIHYSLISAVNINGDISLWDVAYTFSERHPENALIHLTQGTSHSCDSDNLTVPFLTSLEHELGEGQEITVSGRVKKLPSYFNVNLLEDDRWFPRPSIILHVNPRFFEEEGYALVFNTQSLGHWGREERVRPSPLKPNQVFTLRIRKDKDNFKIFYNETLVCMFVDRLTVPVRAISINGDVVLNSIVLS